MNIRGKEDPYLKIGETNDRSTKGSSDYVWALKDIDFKVEQGDVVGIIGKNGAGKSTLLKLLSKVTGPTTGSIRARGRIGALLEVGTGFHSEMTGRENIFLNGAILGMSKQEIAAKLDEIVDFSGCERYLDTPVKRYSSGMMVRLGFAVAAHLDPEILVVDEVLAVGDAEFQKKAIGKMQDVSKGEGRTVLFVSHNMAAVKTLCKSGILLNNGMVSYRGDADEAVNLYLQANAYKPTDLLSSIVYYNNLFTIETITLNGQEQNYIKIDRNNSVLEFNISGIIHSEVRLELEAQLYDESNTLLASFCPCHIKGKSSIYEEGAFSIKESIELPKNLTAGKFYLEVQLTEPYVEYKCALSQPILIESEGIIGDSGIALTYKDRGLLVLLNDTLHNHTNIQ